MTHTIITPTEIKARDTFYEGALELVPRTDELKKGPKSLQKKPLPPRPLVTLGQPQEWNLASLAREKGESLPAELSVHLHEADFYLLQLACSFRPEADSEVTNARFVTHLRPKVGSAPPVALDLFPREIYDESQTDVKVKIAPSLKFAAFQGASVEGGVGEVMTTIEFKKLEPVVIAFGLLESTPGWNFQAHRLYPLRGAKFCYLIVKKPRSAQAVRLIVEITADVRTKQGLFKAEIAKKDRDYLSQVVCTS